MWSCIDVKLFNVVVSDRFTSLLLLAFSLHLTCWNLMTITSWEHSVASLFTDCVCWCGNPATASDKRSKSNQEAAENDAYCGQMGGGYDTTMCGRGMEFDMSPEENTTIASCFNAHSADMSRYKMKISPLPSSSPGRRRGSNGSRSQQESAELDPAVLSKEYSSPKLSLEYSADLTSTI